MTTLHARALHAKAFVTLVCCAGAAIFALSLRSSGTNTVGLQPVLIGLFAFLMVFLELRPMGSITEDSQLTFSWTFAITLLFVGTLPVALGIGAFASVIAEVVARRPLNRIAFNASQFIISLSAGWLVAQWIADPLSVVQGGAVDLPWSASIVAASVVAFLVNNVLVAIVVGLTQGLPVGAMLRRFISDNLVGGDGILLALAPIFVIVGVYGLLMLPLLLVTVRTIVKSASLALSNRAEATHDQLTGIPNRRMFETHGALVLDQARSSQTMVGVLHIDLDGFKGINDRLGHHFGDVVLKEISSRLVDAKRSVDLVSRLGGDEFAITLGELDDADMAVAVGERLLRAIEVPLEVEGVPLSVSASIGIAVFPRHGQSLDELLRSADLAMYRAKANAEGVRMFESSAEHSVPGRLAVLSDLTEAFEQEQLQLAFQPKARIGSGRIEGVEALLRWRHPVYGDVPPGHFMPQAEQTDLITPLTDAVLRMALVECRRWNEAGLGVPVAINVSARNLHDLRFPERVSAALEHHGLEADMLEIEITENSIMEDPVRSAAVLSELRALGVKLSIDDFGTGYSSLASLRNLQIDSIKIDRSFVTTLDNNPANLTIVRSVVDLGRNLGLNVVAEGVECEQVLDILTDLGCQHYQGFHLSPPTDGPTLQAILSDNFDQHPLKL